MKELITAAAAVTAAVILWKKKRITGTGMLLVMLLAAAGVGYCIIRGFSGEWIPVSSVERGEKGSGSRQMQFQVQAEEDRDSIVLEIPAVQLSEEEADAELESLLQRLEREILGENQSLSDVCYPLQLQTSYTDSPVSVQWQTDLPEYLSREGKLGAEIPEAGVQVFLQGRLMLNGRTEIFQRKVHVFPSRDAADFPARIRAEAGRLNREGENAVYQLPESLDGISLQWYQLSDSTGWLLVCLAVLLLMILVMIRLGKIRDSQKSRKEELDREYPELVSRMQMLLGAGLGMRSVLERIGREYRVSLEKNKGSGKGYRKKVRPNPAYEEILISCRELENGISEAEVYRRFGNRCGTPSYRGLSLMLEQNMTKGGQGLMHLLEQEALEAFETRQRRARQEGEKVSVRLLLPMGMMLVVVLALVMIPAFMTF